MPRLSSSTDGGTIRSPRSAGSTGNRKHKKFTFVSTRMGIRRSNSRRNRNRSSSRRRTNSIRRTHEESVTDGRRRRPADGPLSPDAPDSLVNRSFLQKKIPPSIRRTKSNKQMPGKENRPYVDMTSLVSQGSGRQPESDVGTTFFMPTIESPDMLELNGEEEAIVRPLHHSILGKEHCFEVITVNGSRCFCCKSAGEREAWIEKIKRTLNPNLDNSRRTEHQLNLWVQEAKGIPVKKRYFCEICLDRQLYARTTSKFKDDNTTFWGEHFNFTSIPDIENITVHLYKDSDKKKKKDKDYIGLVNISVQTLTNRQIVEKWYNLSTPSGNNKNKSGEIMAIRIKARFQSVCVLPMEQYKDFAEFISHQYMPLCATLKSVLTVAKKDELSRSLVSIMHSTGTIKEFMTEIVMSEIANVEEESLIFRENTIATKGVEHFLRLVGMGYLHEALGEFVRTIYNSDEECEVDGSRLPANAVLEANQKNLQMCCEIAMCKIIDSINIFPSELRDVFSTWRARCEECDRPRIASRLVTASLFLRLLCPSILNPQLFELANELPKPNAARTLTLVAKVIQNLANRSRFGDKEEYMKFMNGFVREQWDQMGEFINSVSDANKPSLSNGFEGFIDLGLELAKLHAFFKENLASIDQNVIIELGNLPQILKKISELTENPTPASHDVNQNGSRGSNTNALDRIAEDAVLSNASDNILMPPESSSTPYMERKGLEDNSGSLMDLVSEGFPMGNSGFSHHSSQTSIPATGSFNNSNNSHRPSLTSTENLTELPGNTQRFQPPSWIQSSVKPPLSFSNPAYQQRSSPQRGISSPASMSMPALDRQTDPTVPSGMKFGPSNGMDPAQSLGNFSQPNQHPGAFSVSAIPTTVSNSQFRQPISSAFKGQSQPLSFTNPLQVLQPSTASNANPRRINPPTISPMMQARSSSQLETVFTTETVTYSTKPSYTSVAPLPKALVRTGQDSSPALKRKPGPVKMVQDSDSLDRASSGGESMNESYHSNESLSSRPSSTTTGSTATSGTANNHNHKPRQSQKPGHQISRPHVTNNAQGSLVEIAPTDANTTAIATTTSIPVASARHRTGLQQQQKSSPAKVATTVAPISFQESPRRTSLASEASKASTRTSRTSGMGVAKAGRNKTQQQQKYHPSLHLVQIEQDAGLALEELPPVTEDTDHLVSGKSVTSTSMTAANATRVRMQRKSRPMATASTSSNQVAKTNGSGDPKYQGSRRTSFQRSTTQQGTPTTPTEPPTAFPPTTPEGPLSPEERTAQWILSSVAPVAKDVIPDVDSHHRMPVDTSNYGPSKMARTKDYDDVITRFKSEIEALKSRLNDAEESNRSLKRREENLLEQVKNSEKREARVQDRVRALEEKMQKQAQEDERKNALMHRITKAEVEQKREREEMQGVIDEKDMIVNAQRKRIDSLEDTNARLIRALNQMKEVSSNPRNMGGPKSDRRPSQHRQPDANDVLDSYKFDVSGLPANDVSSRNVNNNAGRHRSRNQNAQSQPIASHSRRPSRQMRQANVDMNPEYKIQNGSPTASYINGEFRIEGISSAGSSSSSV